MIIYQTIKKIHTRTHVLSSSYKLELIFRVQNKIIMSYHEHF